MARTPKTSDSTTPIANAADHNPSEPDTADGTDRRHFLGYLVAAPTLAVAAQFGGAVFDPASAAIPSLPQPADLFDLNDLLTAATLPTSGLIKIVINKDGSASFAMPRLEMGQGIATSTAMIIAEELDLPLDKVHVTLADARPELLFNQFTAGSNSTISTYTPFRVAAALARKQLIGAASIVLGDAVTELTAKAGMIISATGGRASYGSLAEKAAVSKTTRASVTLKQRAKFSIIGTPQNRTDALEAVTGRKKYAMDLNVPNALPTMICRAPTINGTVKSVQNAATVAAMPGITDVVTIDTGVAVRGATFGQCIDAIRQLKVTWGPGTVDNESDATVLKKIRAAELPLVVPKLPLLAKSIESEFVFHWKSNSALEPQTAIADVRKDRAEIWSAMQSPILTQERIAAKLNMPVNKVTAHVVQAGGAFGRRMFANAPIEAAEISQKIGKPVKLMWHRTDEFRFGRVHPICTSRIRASYLLGNVLTFEQRHTGVSTDYTQGFGEAITGGLAQLPAQNFIQYSTTIFETTVNVPYNFGVVTQLLNETEAFDTYHTGSARNLFNPDVVTAVELMVDQLAAKLGKDPYKFRREFLKDKRAVAVLDAVAKAGNWGKKMPKNTAQGIALHSEYKGVNAALVEVDARPETINRPIRDGVTGPRVTKVILAIDIGLAINPRGLAAQMEGGITDAIGQIFTESLHLKDGHFLEGSWDEYFYTREWNTPPEVRIIVMPPTTGKPGGAGEFGVATAKAAVATAYARAVGKMPTSFPINHHDALEFGEPLPTVPSIPQSPTDGLKYQY